MVVAAAGRWIVSNLPRFAERRSVAKFGMALDRQDKCRKVDSCKGQFICRQRIRGPRAGEEHNGLGTVDDLVATAVYMEDSLNCRKPHGALPMSFWRV